jgi:L-cysteate sulfo-lyase
MMQPIFPDRVNLAHLPTPIDKLVRLSESLGGPTIYMKRDDQTGLALGGNKTRKLEFLAADALGKGCDYLVTTGAPQSNHCRQTAAAAAAVGLGCRLVLRGNPVPDREGNILLDLLLGAELVWSGENAVDDTIQEVMSELRTAGHTPYLIPLGGSNELGATGYVVAMGELMEQLASQDLAIDAMIVASSSGGTQAGLVLGAQIYGYEGQILGISIEHPSSHLSHLVSSLVTSTAQHLGFDPGSEQAEILVNDGYLGEGYGIVGHLEREAISMVAKYEGILLDPVYTGRAMGGLADLIKSDVFFKGQRILFWHTGGSPAVFAYGQDILQNS